MKQFLIYAIKWQLGSIVLVPALWILNEKFHLGYLLSTFIAQLFGAIVFFPVDKWIFNKTHKKHLTAKTK